MTAIVVVVGFCGVSAPTRDRPAADGTAEVAAIYVHPDHWRCGRGDGAARRRRDGLRRDGWARVTLWVLDRIARGRAFSGRCGFVADGARQELRDLGAAEIRLARRVG